MPPSTLIVPAEIAHVYALAPRMRREDVAEGLALGIDPRRGLRACFKAALIRRTWLVDGEVAAMWGLAGDVLSDIGAPWLLTSASVERAALAFVKGARREVADMLAIKPRLENHVLASYDRAVRFLELLGFELDPAAPYGPKGESFRRFWMLR